MAARTINGGDVTDTGRFAAAAESSSGSFGSYADELGLWARSRTMRAQIIRKLTERGIPEIEAESAARMMRMSLIHAEQAVRTAGQELAAVADACNEVIATANQANPKIRAMQTGL